MKGLKPTLTITDELPILREDQRLLAFWVSRLSKEDRKQLEILLKTWKEKENE